MKNFKIKLKNILNNKLRIDIIRLKTGIPPELDKYYAYQKKFIAMPINIGDRVIDIGSGGYPFPLATHLADLYIGETSHRTELFQSAGQPVVHCDIEKLPFKNKAFDFVYCSHVLEHVDDPAKACNELMRIGKGGYIETPTKTSDIMFNFVSLKNHHKWHIELLEDTLVFMEWKNCERRDMGTNYFFDQVHSQWKNPLQDMFYNNRDLFVNFLNWKTIFRYIILDNKGDVIGSNFNYSI